MTKGLVRANNFSDLADKDEAVVNLGLSAADYAALKGLYTTAGIDFAVIGEIGNSQGNYQAQLDGIGTTLSGVVLSGYVNRSGDTILGTWTHSGIINISSGLPSGYPASTDSLFSLSIESGEAVIVASGLIASGLSYNGVRQSSSTVQRAFPPSGFSPLHLIPLQVGGQSFFAEAGESPSFYIAPARTGHALDLVTGNLLGTYNSASPALAVGPDGVLFQPAANAPVIEYDPATLQCLGARIWGAVTNLLLRSEDFGNAIWFNQGTAPTVSVNAAIAPDGTSTADRITFAAGDSRRQQTFTTTNGATYTFSVYVKAVSSSLNQMRLAIYDGVLQLNSTDFTVSNTQWQRISFTVTSSSSSNFANVQIRNSLSNALANDIYVWGAQLQTGSTLGPYVPTTTLAASSTADVWSITGADFGRIWNQSAATMYADAGTPSAVPSGPFPRVVVADDAATRNNQVQLAYYSEGQVNFIRAAAGVQAEFYPSIFAQNYPKVALAVAADNIAGASNGAITGTDSAAVMPTVDRLLIGNENLASNFLNGYIRELAIFRSRRPNANLQAMTS